MVDRIIDMFYRADARKIAKLIRDHSTDESLLAIAKTIEDEIEDAKPKAPWRKVVEVHHNGPANPHEVLECGHIYYLKRTARSIEANAKKRRCKQCEAASLDLDSSND